MDTEGMGQISTLQSANFGKYLKRTCNTICGRNPIQGFMRAAESKGGRVEWVRYEKSGEVEDVEVRD